MTTALAFLHGGQHGSWCWERLLQALPAQETAWDLVVTLDVPGCGRKRGQADPSASLASVAQTLHAELRATGAQQVLLVGHSMAGVLLPHLAAIDPAFYKHLVYLSACVPRVGDSILSTMGGTLRGVDPCVVGWPLDPLSTPPLQMMQAMFGPDLDEATLAHLMTQAAQDVWPEGLPSETMMLDPRDLAVPATYIATLRDPILPPVWQGRFAERAGARAMPTLDTPHEAFLSHPAELARLLQQIASQT